MAQVASMSKPGIDGALVRSLRLRAGMSQDLLAGRCGHRGSWVSRIESGELRLDSIADAVRLCRVLNVPLATLVEGTEIRSEEVETLSPVPALSGLELSWTTEGALSALRTIIEDGDGMNRRGFLAASGSTLTAAALAWAEGGDSAALATEKTTGRIVTQEAVDNLDLMTSTLRRLDEHLDRPTAMAVVRQNLGSVKELLVDRSYTESVARGLHGVAGEMLRLCGRLAYEGNDHGLAQRYWRAGKYQATAAGDRALGANIVAFESDEEFDRGNMVAAAQLARAAREGYTGESPRLVARFALQEAIALGAIGERRLAQSALDVASSLMSDFDSTPSPDWSHWVDEATVHAMSGTAYLALKDWENAERSSLRATQIAGSWADSVPHELSRHKIRLATVYARRSRPDVEQAVALGTEALDLLSATGATPPVAVVERAQGLAHDLSIYHNPQIRAFSGRVRALSAA